MCGKSSNCVTPDLIWQDYQSPIEAHHSMRRKMKRSQNWAMGRMFSENIALTFRPEKIQFNIVEFFHWYIYIHIPLQILI